MDRGWVSNTRLLLQISLAKRCVSLYIQMRVSIYGVVWGQLWANRVGVAVGGVPTVGQEQGSRIVYCIELVSGL